MNRLIEVIYENNVLKPLSPIEGIGNHEKAWVILCSKPKKDKLRELVGTLSHEEADKMQKLINEEFGKIEGEW